MGDLANKRSNLILIGFMGTGKSTVGRRVAQSLDFRFVDTDDLIVERAGKSIPQIFADDGEEVFRQIEREILAERCEESHQVISTGGGVVTREENHAIMREGGIIIWLRASPEVIYQRVSRNNERPLLETDNPMETIRNLLEAREAFYQSCADLTITTDDLSLEETVYGVTETARFWQIDGKLE